MTLDDPFSGYISPLTPHEFEGLKRTLLDTAAALPLIDFTEIPDVRNMPGSAASKREALKDVTQLRHALDCLFQIGRSYDPRRFNGYDEKRLLIEEVKTYWSETRRNPTKAYRKRVQEESTKASKEELIETPDSSPSTILPPERASQVSKESKRHDPPSSDKASGKGILIVLSIILIAGVIAGRKWLR